MTHIQVVRLRLAVAERVSPELHGRKQDGLQLQRVDQYTVVDDGQDRWLIKTEHYSDAVESVVSYILDGDLFLPDDPAEPVEWYNALCQESYEDCIYSRCGGGTLDDVFALNVTENVVRELFEALGEDYAEYLESVGS